MKVFVLIAIGALLGFSFVGSEAFAHAPTSVTAVGLADTETHITVTWVHLGTAAANGCGSGCGLGDAKRFVDVLRDGTNIVNNSTAQTFVDTGLVPGVAHMYVVCHGDPDTTNCAITATNAAKADQVQGITPPSAPAGITLSASTDSIFVQWDGTFAGNGTGGGKNLEVGGLKIETSKDGGVTFTTATSNSSATGQLVGSKVQKGGTDGVYEVTGLESGQEYQVRISSVTEPQSIAAVDPFRNFLGSITTESATNDKPKPKIFTATIANGDMTGGNLKVSLYEDMGWDRF